MNGNAQDHGCTSAMTDQVETWVWRDLDGVATPAERMELQRHVEACPACRARRARLAELHGDLGAVLECPDASRQRVTVTGGGGGLPGARIHWLHRAMAMNRTRVAAAAAVLLAVAAWFAWPRIAGTPVTGPEAGGPGGGMMAQGNGTQDHGPASPDVAGERVLASGSLRRGLPGERGEVVLRDGSLARLHAGGLALESGSCFLHVIPGRGAYVVEAGGVQVQVLGTRFGVDRQGDGVRVGVTEGRVLVKSGDRQRVLVAGEALEVGGDGLWMDRELRTQLADAWEWVPVDVAGVLEAPPGATQDAAPPSPPGGPEPAPQRPTFTPSGPDGADMPPRIMPPRDRGK